MADKSKQSVVPPAPRITQGIARADDPIYQIQDWIQRFHAAAEKGDGFSGRALAQIGKAATRALPTTVSDPPTQAEVNQILSLLRGLGA